MQINKYIASCGVCSRRKVDELIECGDIFVNNKKITDPAYRLKPDDVVSYKGKIILPEEKIYILLNKPRGYLTTVADERGRKTVLDIIDLKEKVRIYPVGRLDRETTGLLLLTNDGDLAHKLSHPSSEVKKRYRVNLSKVLSKRDFIKIKSGLELDDGFIKPDSISFLSDDHKIIEIELHSGKKRIIRRIFLHLGYRIKNLDRFYYAGLTKKDLEGGGWRYLTKEEIKNLI